MITEIIRWISVDDEMPDVGTTVLMFGPDYSEVIVGAYDDSETPHCWVDSQGFACDYEITHWASLPDGPIPEAPPEES